LLTDFLKALKIQLMSVASRAEICRHFVFIVPQSFSTESAAHHAGGRLKHRCEKNVFLRFLFL